MNTQSSPPLNWIFDSNEQAIHNLIRCFTREIAPSFGNSISPSLQSFSLKTPDELDACPIELRTQVEIHKGALLSIKLSNLAIELVAAVNARPSQTGVHEYLGLCFYKKTHANLNSTLRIGATPHWYRVTPLLLGEFISNELNHFHKAHPEPDFLIHLQDSLRVAGYIFDDFGPKGPEGGRTEWKFPLSTGTLSPAQASFINSEQSLIFGHPFHPSPKSRLGFTQEEVRHYSPEFAAKFQLDYFLVRREFLFQESLLAETSDQITRKYSFQDCEVDPDFAVLPSHPWQAKYLLQLPVIQEGLKQDKLRYMGMSGLPYFATSSVRTLFSPQNPYFYKLSLNVRITNCIRRNALHELQGSLAVSKIIASLQDSYQKRYPHFHVLDEPAFITANLSPSDSEPNPIVTDGFGLLFRKAIDSNVSSDTSIFLTGSLFGNQSLGRKWISQVISPDRKAWFSLYLDLLIGPLFDLFFEEGVMFEPHLQNALVGLRNKLPTQFWIRDFDNTRIISNSRSQKKLQSANEKVKGEFTYDLTQAWKRFVYCLVVNHLCEAIYQLAFQNPELEVQLWKALKDALIHYASRALNTALKQSIENLLQGATLPAKANLLTRLSRTTDSKASYVSIPNPMSFFH